MLALPFLSACCWKRSNHSERDTASIYEIMWQSAVNNDGDRCWQTVDYKAYGESEAMRALFKQARNMLPDYYGLLNVRNQPV